MRPLKVTLYLLGIALSLVYLLNPGAGAIELLPDYLPIVGNLDEAGMVALLLGCVRALRRMRQLDAELAQLEEPTK